MWLGGPRQTQAATSEKIDRNIGGADYHMQLSGSCDVVGEDDEESILKCRQLLAYLPQNFREKPPDWKVKDNPDRKVDELINIVPDEYNQSYDMHDVIKQLVDDEDYFEIDQEVDPALPDQNRWRVRGVRIERAAAMTNWNYYEAQMRFQRILEALGISDALERAGVKDGDVVMIGGTELIWGEQADG